MPDLPEIFHESACRENACWKNAWSLDDLTRLARGSFIEQLGVRFVELGADWLTAELTIRPATAHAGVALALAEAIGTLASRMAVEAGTHIVSGLDIKANHCRPMDVGETVRATARPLNLGRQTHEWEVRIQTAGDERLVCVARLTTAIKIRAGQGVRAAA
jgi:1,4-dihydroxy-2-naphthoyl-CoA hydrolase